MMLMGATPEDCQEMWMLGYREAISKIQEALERKQHEMSTMRGDGVQDAADGTEV
jgi:hypothetical protein